MSATQTVGRRTDRAHRFRGLLATGVALAAALVAALLRRAA